MSGTRVYVGNLPMDIRTREVEDIFYKYGRIRDIDVKFPSRPPAFAFVDFEDARDAEDAIRGRDGYDYDGARLRVEPANGGRRDSGRDAGRGSARYPRNIRGTGDFTVEISNLPPRVSWQDLKDFMRKVGDVVFTEVDGRGGGIVEYSNKRDMQYAVEKLDDTEFRGRSENSFVRVRLAGRGRSNSRSNSRSRSRSRSSARRSSKKRSRSRSEGERDGEKKAKRSASPDKEPEKEKDADDQKEAGDQKDGKPQEADADAASANDQKDDVMEEPKNEQLVEAEPEKKEDEPKKEEQAEVEKEAEAPKDEAPKDEAPREEAPKEA